MCAAPVADDIILVVDDDEDVRAGFTAILARAGYAVREAADGRSALGAIEAHAPSLVLLDVSMPGMDGLEVLRRLRQGHPSLPVILLTGQRLDPESIGSGLELGAEEYLPKPVRAGELTARIRALLRLHAARRELEALRRDQSAMLVHDLKQPLAVIALRAEFVADEASDEELKRSGLAIREACRQMEQLVSSLLELSRVEAGQLRLERAPCALAPLVTEVVEQFRGLAERRGQAMRFDDRDLSRSRSLTQAELLLALDRPKIVQVLQNLVGNALKFTPAGGRIEVSLLGGAREVIVAVEDTGPGLQPDELEQVFDKWQQTQLGRARGGTGLGLAIARAIVEAHGGRIGAGPRADGARGARFWFTLPADAGGPRHAIAL